MGKVFPAAVGAVAIVWTAGAAQAGVIENLLGQFDASIDFYAPVGQSFIAIDPDLVSIGFAYSDLNPDLSNDPITMDLYAGNGTGGALIASRVFTLPAVLPSVGASPTIIDTDFSGVQLTVGQEYTAALSTTSFKVAVLYGADGYLGGATTSNLPQCTTGCDVDFRVVGTDVGAVPEPSAWALMLTGFFGLGATLRSQARRARGVQAS